MKRLGFIQAALAVLAGTPLARFLPKGEGQVQLTPFQQEARDQASVVERMSPGHCLGCGRRDKGFTLGFNRCDSCSQAELVTTLSEFYSG